VIKVSKPFGKNTRVKLLPTAVQDHPAPN